MRLIPDKDEPMVGRTTPCLELLSCANPRPSILNLISLQASKTDLQVSKDGLVGFP